jgi:hypothetical protein
MTRPTPNGARRSWEYPPCPECESDVLVEKRPGVSEGYVCWGCDRLFDERESPTTIDGQLVTDGGRDSIEACPECDSPQIEVRPGGYRSLPYRVGEERYCCEACGARFDDPVRRARKQPGENRSGTARRLVEADPNDLVPDGGTYPCSLCSAEHEGLEAALRCCGEKLRVPADFKDDLWTCDRCGEFATGSARADDGDHCTWCRGRLDARAERDDSVRSDGGPIHPSPSSGFYVREEDRLFWPTRAAYEWQDDDDVGLFTDLANTTGAVDVTALEHDPVSIGTYNVNLLRSLLDLATTSGFGTTCNLYAVPHDEPGRPMLAVTGPDDDLSRALCCASRVSRDDNGDVVATDIDELVDDDIHSSCCPSCGSGGGESFVPEGSDQYHAECLNDDCRVDQYRLAADAVTDGGRPLCPRGFAPCGHCGVRTPLQSLVEGDGGRALCPPCDRGEGYREEF